MDRGIYSVAGLGLKQFRKLDVVNNNLANLNTPGFKKQVLVGEVQTFDATLAKTLAAGDPYAKGDHERTPSVMNLKTITDFSPGPIKNTGNTFDLALRNQKDFFLVNTPEGIQLTRAGNFTLNTEGSIVTSDGMEVQGDGGAVVVNGPNVDISPNGTVKVNGSEVGKIQVVRVEDPNVLERVGGNRFKVPEGAPAPATVDGDLVPRALEMSNVSAVTNIIDLISANRGFDMYVRTSQTVDQMNQSAISQIGRRM